MTIRVHNMITRFLSKTIPHFRVGHISDTKLMSLACLGNSWTIV